MENNTLSINNFAKLLLLSLISKSYDDNNDIIEAFIPSNIVEQISSMLEKDENILLGIIDKDSFINFQDKWAMRFWEVLREVAKELKIEYLANQDGSALKIHCSKLKSQELIELYNSSPIKEKMGQITASLNANINKLGM